MDDDARKQRALAPADEAGRREALANEAYRRRAEAQPTLRRTNFSPARMLFVAPNSAPNSGRISPIETLAAPRVRIPLASSLSPRCLAHQPLRTSTPCSTSARTISSMKKGLPWRSLEDSKYPAARSCWFKSRPRQPEKRCPSVPVENSSWDLLPTHSHNAGKGTVSASYSVIVGSLAVNGRVNRRTPR